MSPYASSAATHCRDRDTKVISTEAQTSAAAPSGVAGGGGDSVALAKKLSNPISDLISLPFQLNYNQGFATGDGDQYTLNIQPVIPFSISADWNVISRTIVPIVSQDGVIPGRGSQFGLGATTQSFFLSPKAPTEAGLIWGVGPVFLIPTATDDIATNQWGAGITGVALRQSGPWTVGALANHIWATIPRPCPRPGISSRSPARTPCFFSFGPLSRMATWRPPWTM